MKKTYYTVYKVINKISGKFYIGTHKTTNLDDGYMGSGKYLKRAIEKHGLDNFEKEILFVYDDPADMFDKESEIVNEDFLTEENTYNLKIGGMGGFDHINNGSDEHIQRCSEAGKIGAKKKFEQYGCKQLIPFNSKTSQAANDKIKQMYPNGTFYGRKHREESKKLIGEANRKMTGQRNSQYGTMWITDGTLNRKIKKDDLIPFGWNRGRL